MDCPKLSSVRVCASVPDRRDEHEEGREAKDQQAQEHDEQIHAPHHSAVSHLNQEGNRALRSSMCGDG